MSLSQVPSRALELAMVVPATALCFMPLWRSLRRPRVALARAAGLAALFILAGALLCARLGLSSDAALLAAAVVCLPALPATTNAAPGKAAFCLANAAMLCVFCAMYTTFLIAPAQLNGAAAPSALIRLGMTVPVGAVCWRTLRVKLPRMMAEAQLDGSWWGLTLPPAAMTAFFWWITPISPEVVMTGRVRPICIVMMPMFLLFMLVLYHLLWRVTVRFADSARLEQENRLLLLESQRYREQREYMDRTRALRHDFRQHLHVIAQLARSGQYERLNEYLAPFEETAAAEHVRYCANPAVDAIAAHYAHRAAQSGVRADFTFDLPEALPVGEADYCVMLGNLLENAFTAAEALPEGAREVRAISRMLSDAMLGLSVENPYAGEVEFGPNGLPTARRRDHGVGMLSVSAVVSRYHGSMEVRGEGGRFLVDILLYL